MKVNIFCLITVLFLPISLFSENLDLKAGKKEEKPGLIVFNITPEKGVEVGTANLLTEFVLTEITKIGKYNVIGQNDLDKMLFWETNKQLKNCNDSSCMAQIAGAMGAEYYVIGSIGTMGDNFMVNLKLINVMRAVVENRVSEVIKKDENELIKQTKHIVAKLFEISSEPNLDKEGLKKEISKAKKNETQSVISESIAKKEVDRGNKGARKWIGYSLLGVGVVGLAVGGYFTKSAMDADDNYKKATASTAEKYNQERIDNNRNAVISYIAGGVLLTGGIAYFIFSSDSENKTNDKTSVLFLGNYLCINTSF